MPGRLRVAAVGLAAAAAVALLVWIARLPAPGKVAVEARIPAIMGTETVLKAVVPQGEEELGRRAIAAAEAKLRELELLFTDWVGTSEIGRINAAPAGATFDLSPHVRAVLTIAHELYGRSRGKFDVTCRPLTSLWRACEVRGREPDEKELKRAVALCGWRQFRLRAGRLEKLAAEAAIDLGGIKGYAVDRAVEAMRALGPSGGLVACGGDMRVFGETEHGRPWTITIGDPRSAQSMRPASTIEVHDAAVSTSGASRRFFVIGQRRYSHILDPDTGWPVSAPIQVTVIAPEATQSDAWSKPLSVLGEKGFDLLPSGVEGMILRDDKGSLHVVKTEGFPELHEARDAGPERPSG